MKIKLIGSLCMVSGMKELKQFCVFWMSWGNVTFMIFLPSPFNQCPFIFIFIHLLSVSCCIHSSAWWVSYLVENEQFVPWRFQLFGSLKDLSLEYQWGEWKVKPGKSEKNIYFFFPQRNVFFRERGVLKSAAWQLKRNKPRAEGCWGRSAISHIYIIIWTVLLQF